MRRRFLSFRMMVLVVSFVGSGCATGTFPGIEAGNPDLEGEAIEIIPEGKDEIYSIQFLDEKSALVSQIEGDGSSFNETVSVDFIQEGDERNLQASFHDGTEIDVTMNIDEGGNIEVLKFQMNGEAVKTTFNVVTALTEMTPPPDSLAEVKTERTEPEALQPVKIWQITDSNLIHYDMIARPADEALVLAQLPTPNEEEIAELAPLDVVEEMEEVKDIPLVRRMDRYLVREEDRPMALIRPEEIALIPRFISVRREPLSFQFNKDSIAVDWVTHFLHK